MLTRRLFHRQLTAGHPRTASQDYSPVLLDRMHCQVMRDWISTPGGPPHIVRFASPQVRHGQLLAVATEQGWVALKCLDKPADSVWNSDVYSSFEAHTNAIFDLTWSSDGRQFFTASGDQTAALWDASTHVRLVTLAAHKGSVKTVRVSQASDGGRVVATGSRDGSVAVWDVRVGQVGNRLLPVAHVIDAHPCVPQRSALPVRKRPGSVYTVSGVAFLHDSRVLASSGATDGLVKLWDLRALRRQCPYRPPRASRKKKSARTRKAGSTMRPFRSPHPKRYGTEPLAQFAPSDELEDESASSRLVMPSPGSTGRFDGISSLESNASGTRLLASCMNNVVYQYGVAGGAPRLEQQYTGHHQSSFFVRSCFSPDEQFVLSGSGDGCAYVWPVQPEPSQPWALAGHGQEVTGVAWSHAEWKVATACEDGGVRIWSVCNDAERVGVDESALWSTRVAQGPPVPNAPGVQDASDMSSRSSSPNPSSGSSSGSSTEDELLRTPNTRSARRRHRPARKRKRTRRRPLRDQTLMQLWTHSRSSSSVEEDEEDEEDEEEDEGDEDEGDEDEGDDAKPSSSKKRRVVVQTKLRIV